MRTTTARPTGRTWRQTAAALFELRPARRSAVDSLARSRARRIPLPLWLLRTKSRILIHKGVTTLLLAERASAASNTRRGGGRAGEGSVGAPAARPSPLGTARRRGAAATLAVTGAMNTSEQLNTSSADLLRGLKRPGLVVRSRLAVAGGRDAGVLRLSGRAADQHPCTERHRIDLRHDKS